MDEEEVKVENKTSVVYIRISSNAKGREVSVATNNLQIICKCRKSALNFVHAYTTVTPDHTETRLGPKSHCLGHSTIVH